MAADEMLACAQHVGDHWRGLAETAPRRAALVPVLHDEAPDSAVGGREGDATDRNAHACGGDTRKDDERLAKPLEIGGDDRFAALPGHKGHGLISGGPARRVGA